MVEHVQTYHFVRKNTVSVRSSDIIQDCGTLIVTEFDQHPLIHVFEYPTPV
jgi:hypothetical protein